MRQDTTAPSNNEHFQVIRVRQVNPALAVGEVAVGPVVVGSIWLTGLDGPSPQVNWPRSGRGFPVVSIGSDRLREAIEARLLETVRSWPSAPEVRA